MAIDVADLYRKHGAMVFRRARAMVGDVEQARDVVQEVFLSLHLQHAALHQGGLISWLYMATTHRCLKLIRDQASRSRLERENADVLTPQSPQDPDIGPLLRRLLPQLDETLAQAAVHRFLDEMSHEEIAQLLGCSRRHVGNLLQRLEQQLVVLRRESTS